MRQKNELARLLENIVNSLPGKEITLRQCIERYIRDPINGIPPDRRDLASARGNLIKTLSKDVVSWKTFTRFLRVLEYDDFDMQISLKTKDPMLPEGSKDLFSINVDLGNKPVGNNSDLLKNRDIEFANSVIADLHKSYIKEEEE